MRRFFMICFLLCMAVSVFAEGYTVDEIPNVQLRDVNRYVSNPDAILSREAESHINYICDSLRRQGIAQVVVVAVKDVSSDDLFSFAIELFSGWGVGRAGDDNGLGIILAEDRREIRFVTGGGLEGVLTDALSKRIQTQFMLPYFRDDNYSAGMVAGVMAVSNVLTGSELDMGLTDAYQKRNNTWIIMLFIMALMGGFFGYVALKNWRDRRCPKCHKSKLVLHSQSVLRVTDTHKLMRYTYVCSNCGEVVNRKANDSQNDSFGGGLGRGILLGGLLGGLGGGRGFGGGGFGGGSGGGGFGGGDFGGGGAGSDW